MLPITFLKPKDGEPDNRQPLDCVEQLPCKTVLYTDPNGNITSIHFTLRQPDPYPKNSPEQK